MLSTKKRFAILSSIFNAPQKRKRYSVEKKTKISLFDQPSEIMCMIADSLTLEEAFNLACTCKSAHAFISSFKTVLKYDWIDNMFKNINTYKAKARNAEYLFVAILQNAKANGQDAYVKLFEWLKDAPENCPNLSIPMLFETLFDRLGERKAAVLIKGLIKQWMLEDAKKYVEAFPVGPDSPQESIEAEKRLIKCFKWVISDRLNAQTKAFLFTLLLRSLADVSDVHKLIYLFCAPRQESSGFIDFEHYAVTHQEAENELNFGNMASAFKLIMSAWKFRIAGCFSNREVFIILEDLTTAPAMWSMHSFVSFLMTSVELCVLSTFVRFDEGFSDDASATFYYTIRANADPLFLSKVVFGVMRLMSKDAALSFVDCVLKKSSQVISATDEANKERLKMLQETHCRALDALNAGLEKYQMRYNFRSSSV